MSFQHFIATHDFAVAKLDPFTFEVTEYFVIDTTFDEAIKVCASKPHTREQYKDQVIDILNERLPQEMSDAVMEFVTPHNEDYELTDIYEIMFSEKDEDHYERLNQSHEYDTIDYLRECVDNLEYTELELKCVLDMTDDEIIDAFEEIHDFGDEELDFEDFDFEGWRHYMMDRGNEEEDVAIDASYENHAEFDEENNVWIINWEGEAPEN